ncbi:hypothetical protein [Burkholderia multivorans]|uniref:hypothetical protein n=1 Tax=Burkholderia multivorans TaxID=87883 RepID=UPI0011B94B47
MNKDLIRVEIKSDEFYSFKNINTKELIIEAFGEEFVERLIEFSKENKSIFNNSCFFITMVMGFDNESEAVEFKLLFGGKE